MGHQWRWTHSTIRVHQRLQISSLRKESRWSWRTCKRDLRCRRCWWKWRNWLWRMVRSHDQQEWTAERKESQSCFRLVWQGRWWNHWSSWSRCDFRKQHVKGRSSVVGSDWGGWYKWRWLNRFRRIQNHDAQAHWLNLTFISDRPAPIGCLSEFW